MSSFRPDKTCNFSYKTFSYLCFNCPPYLLTRWSRLLLEKLTGSAASQEIPRIFGTRRFLTVPTSARHLSLSRANSIQSPQPPPTSWRSSLILSSHLRLGLPNGLFPSGFPARTLRTPLPSPIRATYPAHLNIPWKENLFLCGCNTVVWWMCTDRSDGTAASFLYRSEAGNRFLQKLGTHYMQSHSRKYR